MADDVRRRQVRVRVGTLLVDVSGPTHYWTVTEKDKRGLVHLVYQGKDPIRDVGWYSLSALRTAVHLRFLSPAEESAWRLTGAVPK